MRPDVHELMHGCKSAQDRPVTNGNVTGQGGGIAENHTVAQDAVVSDMCVGHDQAIHAHFRISKRLCSAIDGGTFAYGGTIANDHLAVFPFEFQVLRNRRNNCSGTYPAVFPDVSTVHNGDIRTDPGSFADLHVLVDRSERFRSEEHTSELQSLMRISYAV